jgi:hypothetical protein
VTILTPTGVSLASSSISRAVEGVRIVWETAGERRILGFNVLRRDGDVWAPLNGELIFAAHSGEDVGTTYELVDATPAAAYVLEVVRLDGSSQRFLLGSPAK